jgi:GNAT superfamily N-acetyltransferase
MRVQHEGSAAIYRPARRIESYLIAAMFRCASGGFADYAWRKLACNGEDPVDAGMLRYAHDDCDFSYRNCVFAIVDGKPVGLIHAYAVTSKPEVADDFDPVLRPFAELQLSGSLYISCCMVLKQCRGRGIGEGLLEIARARAEAEDVRQLSTLIYDTNSNWRRQIERNGFQIVGRRPLAKHPLLKQGGELLLYAAPVAQQIQSPGISR